MENQNPSPESLLANKRHYEVDGVGISLGSREFLPQNAQPDANRLVLYLPGWSLDEKARITGEFAQEYANQSGAKTIAINTTAEKSIPSSLEAEAEALRRYIEEVTTEDINNITVVGNSQGAAEATHLLVKLKDAHPELNLDAVFTSPVGLVEKGFGEFAGGYIKDMGKTQASFLHVVGKNLLRRNPKLKHADKLPRRNEEYLSAGTRGIVTDIAAAKTGAFKKTHGDIREMTQLNPHLAEIHDIPLVIFAGEKDLLGANPSDIIPDPAEGEEGNPYATTLSQRTEALAQLFPRNAENTRVVVDRKWGHHNASHMRIEQTVNVAEGMLKRIKRPQVSEGNSGTFDQATSYRTILEAKPVDPSSIFPITNEVLQGVKIAAEEIPAGTKAIVGGEEGDLQMLARQFEGTVGNHTEPVQSGMTMRREGYFVGFGTVTVRQENEQGEIVENTYEGPLTQEEFFTSPARLVQSDDGLEMHVSTQRGIVKIHQDVDIPSGVHGSNLENGGLYAFKVDQ